MRITATGGVVGLIAMAVSFGPTASAPATGTVEADGAPVEFATQACGPYEGMPLFDGNPDHLDRYLEVFFEYAGPEGIARWALQQRGDYTLRSGPHAGRVIPGAERYEDHDQGVATDFPMMIGMGQSWNLELVEAIGGVIGDEQLYTTSFLVSISDYNAVTATAIQELRANPLAGRYDEGFSEDPLLNRAMVASMALGASGVGDGENGQGFWTKNILTVKHFTNYASEWFRRAGDAYASQRALMELHVPPIESAVRSGAASGFMTSFGRSNGIPNPISPLISRVHRLSPWSSRGGLYGIPDYHAETQLGEANAFANAYDSSYSPTLDDGVALMMVAEAGGAATSDDPADTSRLDALLESLAAGTYGVTLEDVECVARASLIPLVRVGLFNERDVDGYPVGYPFVDLTADRASVALDATLGSHQAVALRAAREGIVLLKNTDGVLPLGRDARLAVVGPLSQASFKTVHAVGVPESVANAHLTPLEGIVEAAGGESRIASSTDGSIVALRSVATGAYLSIPDGEGGETFATASTPGSAARFEAFSWGQDGGYSYRSLDNGRWLDVETESATFFSAGTPVAIRVSGQEALDAPPTGPRATMPERFRIVPNDDGTVAIVVNSYTESFAGGAETAFYDLGQYLRVDDAGRLGFTDVLGDPKGAESLKTEAARFVVEVVQETGTDAAAFRESGDAEYAVVVVGAPARHSSGEGADRGDLYLGTDQYDLVRGVAEAYPERTIVVVNANYPVVVEELKRNDGVAAILYQPYGGQYAGLALGQVLFGDYAPTGRLTSTWYADMGALPPLGEHAIPQGPDATVTLERIDPKYSVDMSKNDPIELGLTYMYTAAEASFEFGFGLSYSEFEYSDLSVSEADGVYTARVKVENVGAVDTSEVVQLYVAHPDSAYGAYAPKKRLAAFGKVRIPAGATRTVELSFPVSDVAVWDVVGQRMTVEAGTYAFHVGRSSGDIRQTAFVPVAGRRIGPLDLSSAPISVFDHAFAASNVIYRETSKRNTWIGLREDRVTNGYSAVMSTGPEAWVALPRVDAGGATAVTLRVASPNPRSTIELRRGSPTGEVLGTVGFGPTEPVSFPVPTGDGTGAMLRELGYREVTSALREGGVGGVFDLYLVFDRAEVRVDTIQLRRSGA